MKSVTTTNSATVPFTPSGTRLPARQTGFGLIELMVALVLGMIIIGAAIGMFISNQNASRATQGISRIQENSRIGFELMARDIRDADSTPCSKNVPIMNVLNGATPGGDWRYNWGNGIEGFNSGTAITGLPAAPNAGSPVPTTPALPRNAVIIHSAADNGVTVSIHNAAAANFHANTTDHGFVSGDIAIACDYRQGAILQITNANGSNVTLVHNTGAGTPGNCKKRLGMTADTGCGGSAGTEYTFQPSGMIAKLHSAAWYIGRSSSDPANRTSLYRKVLDNAPEEIVDNVSQMEIQYLLEGSNAYVVASPAIPWKDVKAVRIRLTVQSPENVAVGGGKLERVVTNNIALRNRNS